MTVAADGGRGGAGVGLWVCVWDLMLSLLSGWFCGVTARIGATRWTTTACVAGPGGRGAGAVERRLARPGAAWRNWECCGCCKCTACGPMVVGTQIGRARPRGRRSGAQAGAAGSGPGDAYQPTGSGTGRCDGRAAANRQPARAAQRKSAQHAVDGHLAAATAVPILRRAEPREHQPVTGCRMAACLGDRMTK